MPRQRIGRRRKRRSPTLDLGEPAPNLAEPALDLGKSPLNLDESNLHLNDSHKKSAPPSTKSFRKSSAYLIRTTTVSQ